MYAKMLVHGDRFDVPWLVVTSSDMDSWRPRLLAHGWVGLGVEEDLRALTRSGCGRTVSRSRSAGSSFKRTT